MKENPASPKIPSSSLPSLPSVLILALLACGCTGLRPLKGGHAVSKPVGGIAQTLVQGENPSAPSRQDQETVKVRTYTLPAAPAPNCYLPSPNSVLVTEREETRAKTELGAAQKDTGREIAAKLASLKGIVWIGLALFIFGLASFFWLPLKAIIASTTTSAAITIGGIALMILPTLIVGNELLILGGVVLAVGAWFLAHRHGQLRGLLDATLNAPRTTEDAPPDPAASGPSVPIRVIRG